MTNYTRFVHVFVDRAHCDEGVQKDFESRAVLTKRKLTPRSMEKIFRMDGDFKREFIFEKSYI